MNLQPEHAQVVRDALAAGRSECWLVVPGEYLDMAEMFDDDGNIRQSPRPPADWVALTGACETCDGQGLIDGPGWPTCACGDGRKRATLTVAVAWTDDEPIAVPLAVATVEVLPVVSTQTTPHPIADPHICVDRNGRLRGSAKYLDPHRQPVPGVDYVIHLTELVTS